MNALCEIYMNWIPKEKILKTNIWSSELAKLTANAFLKGWFNKFYSAICEETGADVEVSRNYWARSRIGPKFLDSGRFGVALKDILNLVYLSEYFGLLKLLNFGMRL